MTSVSLEETPLTIAGLPNCRIAQVGTPGRPRGEVSFEHCCGLARAVSGQIVSGT